MSTQSFKNKCKNSAIAVFCALIIAIRGPEGSLGMNFTTLTVW